MPTNLRLVLGRPCSRESAFRAFAAATLGEEHPDRIARYIASEGLFDLNAALLAVVLETARHMDDAHGSRDTHHCQYSWGRCDGLLLRYTTNESVVVSLKSSYKDDAFALVFQYDRLAPAIAGVEAAMKVVGGTLHEGDDTEGDDTAPTTLEALRAAEAGVTT